MNNRIARGRYKNLEINLIKKNNRVARRRYKKS